ncbi:LysR family transcriptional regulator [Actinomadura sp. NBRC 104412]|uniref:LysR substrate-binding domain-containing protein n=1 Tax=Actinomadura sp. NBRC 104412 TaxID=3032203 RepID=UPI0024A0264C|nr:LysR substrate-binding domain-containing protein [Actinomadura sp. NBRC 104412]GLZ08268.1 LysR family transcriptional regulator [Actinomadura sp. NBRC 104412]
MDLQQLRYVVAVAETRNFTRAAERCFIAQSALSQRVANLERELGVKLFARTSRRVEITPAGEAFLPSARQALEAAERAVAEAAAAVGLVRGRLAVGVIPTVAAIDMPAVLQHFRERHPEVRVSLRVGGSDLLTAQVASGELDVAALGLPEGDRPRGVRVRRLAVDRLVAVVPATHPLAGEARVGLRRLAEETFVDFPARSPGRAQSDRAFAAAGLVRDVAFEVTVPDLLVRIVRQGLAIALLPSAITGNYPGLATVPVVDGPSRVEYLIWSEFNPSPATQAFLRSLDEVAKRAD